MGFDLPSRWAFPLDRAPVGRCARERLAERTRRERSTLSALITNRMGIDIYAEWDGMTGAEAQPLGLPRSRARPRRLSARGLSRRAVRDESPRARGLRDGSRSNLRRHASGSPAGRSRVAEQREREIYGETSEAEINRILRSYADFVELCARKEAETGEPCLIVASY